MPIEAAEEAMATSLPSDKVPENPAIAKAKKALQSFLLKFESLDQDFKEDPKFEQASNNLKSAKQKGTFHGLLVPVGHRFTFSALGIVAVAQAEPKPVVPKTEIKSRFADKREPEVQTKMPFSAKVSSSPDLEGSRFKRADEDGEKSEVSNCNHLQSIPIVSEVVFCCT